MPPARRWQQRQTRTSVRKPVPSWWLHSRTCSSRCKRSRPNWIARQPKLLSSFACHLPGMECPLALEIEAEDYLPTRLSGWRRSNIVETRPVGPTRKALYAQENPVRPAAPLGFTSIATAIVEVTRLAPRNQKVQPARKGVRLTVETGMTSHVITRYPCIRAHVCVA